MTDGWACLEELCSMYASLPLQPAESPYSATRLSRSPATIYGNLYSVTDEASLRETDLITPDMSEYDMSPPTDGDTYSENPNEKGGLNTSAALSTSV